MISIWSGPIWYAYGNTAEYTYDEAGNLLLVVDALGNSEAREYDEFGRMTSVTDPSGVRTEFSYDMNGNLKQVIDGEQKVINYGYDELNRLASITAGDGVSHSYAYDSVGNLIMETNGNGNSWLYEYDKRNQLIEETDPLNARKQYGYDPAGNLEYLVDFNGNRQEYSYDELNRLKMIEYADGNLKQFDYDPSGNLTKEANGLVEENYFYDSLGRLTEARSVSSELYDEEKVSAFAYDPVGNRISRTLMDAGRERTTAYTYDELNRLTGIEDSEGRESSFEYDPLGRVTQRLYPDNTGADYTYDEAGRLRSVKVWEGRGFRKEVINAEGYLYDNSGRQNYKITEDGEITAYIYDEAGRIESVMYPFGNGRIHRALRERVEAGLVVRNEENNQRREWNRGIYGLEASERASIENTFDEVVKENDYLSYLMDFNDDKKQNGKNEYQIERDDSALTFKSRLDLSWEERNELGELYDEVKPEFGRSMNYSGYYWKEEYAYDNASNIDYRLDGYGKIDFTTDEANHLIGKGEISYSYDSNGNLSEETLGTKTRSYGYSMDNRLTSVETVNPQAMHPGIELPKASYGYDALGRRVLSETVNPPNPGYGNLETEREVYRYDGRSFNIAEVYNMVDPLRGRSDKTERYEYQYAGRSILAVEEIQENQRYRHRNSSDNNVTRYFQDSLGSTITTVTGNRKENYTYSVFGSNMEGDLENAYMVGYNGKREDEVTGFYNYGFRDYSPQMMRFTTEDPIRSGLNWYVYVNNDPVNKIDLWGLTESDAQASTNPFVSWAEKPTGAPLTDAEASVQTGIGSGEMVLGAAGVVVSGTASTVGGAYGIFPSLWSMADGANLISEAQNNTKATPGDMFIKLANPSINTNMGGIDFVVPLP